MTCYASRFLGGWSKVLKFVELIEGVITNAARMLNIRPTTEYNQGTPPKPFKSTAKKLWYVALVRRRKNESENAIKKRSSLPRRTIGIVSCPRWGSELSMWQF
jgi:hypothetical protein